MHGCNDLFMGNGKIYKTHLWDGPLAPGYPSQIIEIDLTYFT